MSLILSAIPIWASILAVLAMVGCAAAIVWVLVVKVASPSQRKVFRILNASLGSGLTAGFMLYATLLANSVWRDLHDARHLVAEEARFVRDVVRLGNEFGGDAAAVVISEIRTYVEAVANEEWPTMTEGFESVRAARTLQSLRHWTMFVAVGDSEVALLRNQLLAALDRVAEYRARRLVMAKDNLSHVIWLTLLVNALVVVVFGAMVHCESPGTAAIMLICYVLMIACAIEVLIVYDRPFVGDISVTPLPLLEAIQP